ncbi:MAG: hypothetical protein DLM72_03775 [Candidatus Nitrosopolaris wilkensis]|nr:MAG: hypothetical protein DLM72_03775 [Candidatus Nitrosopolaris wilkensis]
MAWSIATNKEKKTSDEKTRLAALTLVNDCYKFRMDLLTNSSILAEAVSFVERSRRSLVLAVDPSSNNNIQEHQSVYTRTTSVTGQPQQRVDIKDIKDIQSQSQSEPTTNRTF